MAIVKVAKIPLEKLTKRELYAMVCYYYPKYSLKEASKLSARDINLLIKIARKMEAIKLYNLTQIAAAPHSKKGHGVKKLLDHFRKMQD